jgi:hypothetical protein
MAAAPSDLPDGVWPWPDRDGGDNDAGAISTYMQAGAQYGLHLLWLLVVLLPTCYFRRWLLVSA